MNFFLFLSVFVVISCFISQTISQSFGNCITPKNVNGECIYLQSCRSIYMLMNSTDLSADDEIYISRSQCGYEKDTPLVCCPPENPNRFHAPTDPMLTQGNFGTCITPNLTDGNCIYLHACKSIYTMIKGHLTADDESYLARSQCGSGYHNNTPLVCCPSQKKNSLLPTPGECGNLNTLNKIWGGETVGIDEYPWMALLEYIHPNSSKIFNCGGVLINERYVLTAGHCTIGYDNPTNWQLTNVVLGEWDTSTARDCEYFDDGERECSYATLTILIEDVICHPLYNMFDANRPHDIALLRLQTPVLYTEFVKPICLPKAENLRTNNFDGLTLTVAGWGITENGTQSDIKREVHVNVVNLNECVRLYRRTRFGAEVSLIPKQLCAGGVKDKDACRGDSGGPLMGIDSTSLSFPYYYLAGIVSFGPTPCGLEGIPGIYTKVGPYIKWIESSLLP